MYIITVRPSSVFAGIARYEVDWPWVDSLPRLIAQYRTSDREIRSFVQTNHAAVYCTKLHKFNNTLELTVRTYSSSRRYLEPHRTRGPIHNKRISKARPRHLYSLALPDMKRGDSGSKIPPTGHNINT